MRPESAGRFVDLKARLIQPQSSAHKYADDANDLRQ